MECEHEKWGVKKRCGLTDKKNYYQHCKICGKTRFGIDSGPQRERERLNVSIKRKRERL